MRERPREKERQRQTGADRERGWRETLGAEKQHLQRTADAEWLLVSHVNHTGHEARLRRACVRHCVRRNIKPSACYSSPSPRLGYAHSNACFFITHRRLPGRLLFFISITSLFIAFLSAEPPDEIPQTTGRLTVYSGRSKASRSGSL